MEKIKSRKIRDKKQVEKISDKKNNVTKSSDVKKSKVVESNSTIRIKGRKINSKKFSDDFVIDKERTIVVKDNEEKIVEDKLDKQAVADDNLSIGVMIFILLICLVLGISLGYILYRLALNSSAIILLGSALK